jgi:hypothetical protein
MPGVATPIKNGWLGWLIASFFLGARPMFLPRITDGRFMPWRIF